MFEHEVVKYSKTKEPFKFISRKGDWVYYQASFWMGLNKDMK